MAGYPRAELRFKLDVDGLTAGSFTEVSGCDASAEPMEYREGNMAAEISFKAAGLRKYGNITLKKGAIKEDIVHEWILKGQNDQAERKNITIRLLDEAGTSVASWSMINAWPIRYMAPDLNASTNEWAVDILELAHEGVVRDY